jgi:hypothetical protein
MKQIGEFDQLHLVGAFPLLDLLSHVLDTDIFKSVFDLKTRSIKRMDVDTLGDELARLWIGQIPNFVLSVLRTNEIII